MLRLKSINEMEGLKVYTEMGDFYGEIEEAFIQGNRVYGWKIKAMPNSLLSKTASGAKKVMVSHAYIKAVGDIALISKSIVNFDEPKISQDTI
ncbi:MAG: PRC-barrel domain-containing protein [Candidatus Nanoarchaeia archaeon]|nr:PRC-barrel domain-containing protein [Candidatus Nanoarchaeia archaeon]